MHRACSEQRLHQDTILLPRTCLDSQPHNCPQAMDLFNLRHGFWENDLQSFFQMSFGDVQQQSNKNNGSEPTLQMKIKPCEEDVLLYFICI
ncbi:transcription factor bHLH77-like isoform X3 [Raphanus sativus]|uniref:Transcription factor bHLH77-like isoform X3 n=1 Tax=Raphanus sativus TaxID=3726 RepID=A0A9W3BUS7_RAPSA|nr:transcription factor bHLH77-like isoform X3 [Raphanus sativus]